MSDDFSFEPSPFNRLNAREQTLLCKMAQIVQFRAGESLLTPNTAPDHGWVINSGHVQLEEGGHVHVLESGESLHWRALLTGHNHATATALDDVQVWQLPKSMLMTLLADNAPFSAEVFAQVAQNLAADEEIDHNRELLSLMLVRVKDAYLQKPFYVDGQLDLVSVCRVLSEKCLTNALVRDVTDGVERIGMFTTTDLRDALLSPQPPGSLMVREVARFELLTLHPQAELFEALLLMLRHRVHRVLVKDGDVILGVLSQLDLMSFMSKHSHLIALQVEQAATVEDLRAASRQVDDSIKLLQRGGVRIRIIAKLVSELHGQIFARLWALLAPPALVQNSCLLVMGSEGRGEQILKTDQDNALLLRDGYICPTLADITRQFSAALLTFGYPSCPGHIMVSNPLWCRPLADFKEAIGHWLFSATPDGPMNLAIFIDARAISGDARLLRNARAHTFNLIAGNDTFLAHMVSAVKQFGEPKHGLWARLRTLQGHQAPIFDLKKLGTFPIVHGARVLALEQGLDALGTAERLRELANQDVLPKELSRDLVETLDFLMMLKVRHNLRQITLGQPVDNLVHLASLSTLERDFLQAALTIIKQFRRHLQLRYRLEI